MSVEAVHWALKQRVGFGMLKATLVAIATLHDGAPVRKSAIVEETGLTPATIARHLRLLNFLGFIDTDSRSVTMRIFK